jgi:GDP-D-mannose 3',5'-epimerase
MASSSSDQKKACVGGGAGFIGSHLAKRLKSEGYYVVCADWKRNEFMEIEEFCDEFMLLDLRSMPNCLQATAGCDEVYNLAADMGGMGFIQSNHSVIFYNNTMIDFNMMEAARRNDCKTFFYSSSACIYPEGLQEDVELIDVEGEACTGLKEGSAWPAKPQDAYGLEKLVTEELLKHYGEDFGIRTRCARFHNIYGPRGTWRGGREKAPAAFVRKALTSVDEVEMWGDGFATRSFCLIDDCVEGILRIVSLCCFFFNHMIEFFTYLMPQFNDFIYLVCLCVCVQTRSDVTEPLNLGSDEKVTMNEMMALALSFRDDDQATCSVKHIPGPQGVRGRNSDNTLIKELLGSLFYFSFLSYN